MAIQTNEWDALVAHIKTLSPAEQEAAAIGFRMGHEEGWWLARTDPNSTVSPVAHATKTNPFLDREADKNADPNQPETDPQSLSDG